MAAITHVHDCDVERRDDPVALNGDFRDCYLNSNIPQGTHNTTNLQAGNGTGGGKGGGQKQRALFYYDLNVFIPAGATITSAVLWLWIYLNDSTPNHVFGISRITRTDWLEDEATWNDYKTGSPWTTPGGDFTFPNISFGTETGVFWKTWDITSMVTDAWINRAGICTFILRRTDSDPVAGKWSIQAKEVQPIQPQSPHHLRVTYTLDGRTFQVLLR